MIQLRLDAGALAALFPEGTEARVELQKAVVAEFLKKNSPRLEFDSQMRREIGLMREQAAELCAKELGMHRSPRTMHGPPGAYQLTDPMKAQVRDLAHRAMREEAEKSIKPLADGVLEDIDRKIEAQLDAEILAKVRAKVHTALASAFPGEGA